MCPAAIAAPVSPSQAQSSFAHSDPQGIAASGSVSEGNTTVSPGLRASGDHAEITNGLLATTVATSPADGFTVANGLRQMVFHPVGLSTDAANGQLSNDVAEVFANTWTDTDTVVRPSAVGAQSFLQIRSAAAPESFSWTIGLPAGQRLAQLDSQTVAVLAVAPPKPTDPAADPDAAGIGDPGPVTGPQPPSPVHPGPPKASSPVPLLVSRPEQPGESQELITDPDGQVRTGLYALESANVGAPGEVIALITTPWAHDANGHPVATSLHASGNTVSVTVSHHGSGVSYPVIAAQREASSDGPARAQTDMLAA